MSREGNPAITIRLPRELLAALQQRVKQAERGRGGGISHYVRRLVCCDLGLPDPEVWWPARTKATTGLGQDPIELTPEEEEIVATGMAEMEDDDGAWLLEGLPPGCAPVLVPASLRHEIRSHSAWPLIAGRLLEISREKRAPGLKVSEVWTVHVLWQWGSAHIAGEWQPAILVRALLENSRPVR